MALNTLTEYQRELLSEYANLYRQASMLNPGALARFHDLLTLYSEDVLAIRTKISREEWLECLRLGKIPSDIA